MQNSNYTYARLWLRTSARALLQCHKQLLTSDNHDVNSVNEDFLFQIRTYLDQLEVPELVEVIHHLTNEISKQCATEDIPEQKFLCYRGVSSEYNEDVSNKTTNVAIPITELTPNTTIIETPKKKIRYYRGAAIEE